MLVSGESLKLITYNKPSLSFAQDAASIGYRAWRHQFPGRSESEITHIFDPHDPDKLFKSMRRSVRRSKSGKFVGVLAVAYDDDSSAPVGFGWGANDTSGPWLERKLKDLGRKPFAWLAQLNVIPAYQRQQIGSSIVSEVYSNFHIHQVPTTYVFEENPRVIQYFTDRLGFAPHPPNPSGQDFFGNGSEPVMQWRLASSSVNDVLRQVSDVYGPLPVDRDNPRNNG